AELSRDAPILLLCLARPELLEERPTWAGGRWNATTLLLDALPAGDARTLVGQLESDLAEDERTRIVAVGGGNPLFLEELVAYRGETGSIEAPPLIRALLQARLDRLPHDERVVIECAAVMGTSFEGEAVAALAPAALRPAVDAHLRTLTVKELVRPGRDEGRYTFRHELICERAYASLPKGVRGRMHEAVAAWLDERGEELPERDALVGYHLEQAALARRELGAPDEALESRAAERLAGAAHAARRLTDLPGAADLWSRALALLGEDDPARAPIAVELAFLSFDAGDVERGSALLDDAERLGDEVCVARARVVRLHRLINFEPDTVPAAVARERERAVPVLEAAGDEGASPPSGWRPPSPSGCKAGPRPWPRRARSRRSTPRRPGTAASRRAR
ncbi:MAG TPA: hypothetical protein VLN26_08455, partial [Gaiellaceae bacterium]|nr:hypothetical protein [Gaiellaceae bacterium]